MKRTLTTVAVLAILAAVALIFLPETAKSEAEQSPSQKELQAAHATAVANAIESAEGKCAPGQSGEQGCFQYLPGTWAAYSTEVAGKVLPQAANERYITESMIRKWKAEGKSDRWIFLMWNQGNGDGWGPGTKDCYKGTNKWGVHYDSCDYAERALAYLAQETL